MKLYDDEWFYFDTPIEAISNKSTQKIKDISLQPGCI